LLRKTKTKNSILRLKLAGEPSKEATSQQPLFPTGGVYLKKSELILLIGSADGIPPAPPSARACQKAEAERIISSLINNSLKKPQKISQ